MSDTHLISTSQTLGTRAGCAILSIGAVAFVPGGRAGHPGQSLLRRGGSAQLPGMGPAHRCQHCALVDAPERSPPATITNPAENRNGLAAALFDLRSFMDGFNEAPIWANGASFDFPILAEAYRLSGTARPWHFRNERDYRTLKALWPDVPQPQRSGTHHNALDDAIHQATHLQMIWKEMQP